MRRETEIAPGLIEVSIVLAERYGRRTVPEELLEVNGRENDFLDPYEVHFVV